MKKISELAGKNPWIWSFVGSSLVLVIISVISENGFSLRTLFMNVTLASFTFLLGISEMLVITSGDGAIDLSIPYIVTLCAYLSANWLKGTKAITGIFVILGVCVLIGLANGIINVFLHVHAMIGTLAVGYILFTIILVYSKSATVQPSPALSKFVQTQFGGLSIITIFCMIFLIFMIVVMYHTKFGKYIHAMGQGHHIAYLAGINVSKMMMLVFVASAVIAGVTGVLLGAYVNGSFQSMGDSYQMKAIAATLVGGTIVSGGKSSVIGTFGGAILLTLLGTMITITGLSSGWQKLIEGAVIILILIAADPMKKRV